jgi:IMP dehydrogenase/GMP reductase
MAAGDPHSRSAKSFTIPDALAFDDVLIVPRRSTVARPIDVGTADP